tara:strand:- start:783 stop:1136 length:354 start_codon:yes stop_codon:yes gene_type:complete
MILKPKQAILLNAFILITVGLASYSIKSSITALIPVGFGGLIGICYMIYEKNHKIVAHICIVLMLLIFISLFMPLSKQISAEGKDMNALMRIGAMQITTLYCIICFVVSFIKARKEQ